MSIEAAVLISLDGPIYWHLPANRSGASLPDSRDLWWDGFWANKDTLLGCAHSHPGSGRPAPSWTDITTFAAVEDGLGKRLAWWITTNDYWVVCRWAGPGVHDYTVTPIGPVHPGYVPWLDELIKHSNYNKER